MLWLIIGYVLSIILSLLFYKIAFVYDAKCVPIIRYKWAVLMRALIPVINIFDSLFEMQFNIRYYQQHKDHYRF